MNTPNEKICELFLFCVFLFPSCFLFHMFRFLSMRIVFFRSICMNPFTLYVQFV